MNLVRNLNRRHCFKSEEIIKDNEKDEDESNRKTQEYKRKPKDYLEESLESAYENGDYSIEDDLTPED